MSTHLRVLDDSYPMNTNMTGFRWFLKILAFFWMKVALKGLTHSCLGFLTNVVQTYETYENIFGNIPKIRKIFEGKLLVYYVFL